MKSIFFCITLSVSLPSLSQTKITYQFVDSVNPYKVIFTNGLTSDSVFSDLHSKQGSFEFSNTAECPELWLTINDNLYFPIIISLTQPSIDFSISTRAEDSLPVLHFTNDTFNEAFAEFQEGMIPYRKTYKELSLAFRSPELNKDSLYTLWKVNMSWKDSTYYSFYMHHGQQSYQRLKYIYFSVLNKSVSLDSLIPIIETTGNTAKNLPLYKYCYKVIHEKEYPLVEGDSIPALALTDINKNRLGVWQQNKLTYLFFWSTWCRGCKPELKTLEENTERTDSLNIRVVIADTDVSFSKWKTYIADKPFLQKTYYYGFMSNDETLFRLGANYLPYGVLIKDGKIVKKGVMPAEVLGLN